VLIVLNVNIIPVFHGIGVSETLDNLGHSGSLLSNSDVNAEKFLLLFSCIVESQLVNNGVNSDGGFAGLTITNDQLTLTTANGHQRVDGLDTSLKYEITLVKNSSFFRENTKNSLDKYVISRKKCITGTCTESNSGISSSTQITVHLV
jgi:hypothetical protein